MGKAGLFKGSVINAKSSFGQNHVKLSPIKYSQPDGLPSYNIKQILKDRKGFLWIATQDGLSRFDGISFLPYTPQSIPKHQICGPDIRKIIEDPKLNALWVLPNSKGINAISTITGNVSRYIPIPKINSDDWNITMTYCNKKLWIGSFAGLKIFDIENQNS